LGGEQLLGMRACKCLAAAAVGRAVAGAARF
jgi:hypothetical protein